MAKSGTPTLRDVRQASQRRAERISNVFWQHTREMAQEASMTRMHSELQVAALRREETRAAEQGQTHQFANYLVSMRRLHIEAQDPLVAK